MAFWSTKAATSLKRVGLKMQNKLLWGAYRNSPSLFRTVPSPTPYGLTFPKIGVPAQTKTPIAIISGTSKSLRQLSFTVVSPADRAAIQSPETLLLYDQSAASRPNDAFTGIVQWPLRYVYRTLLRAYHF